MTLVFITPPSIRLGENVVWVQAWRWAAAAAFGSSSSAASMRAGSSSAALTSSGRPSDSTRAGHSSWKRGAGRYSASRCTTAAALTSALSMRNGIEPCPGVPRTRRRRQATPFSATVTPMTGASAGPSCSPPLSVST